MLHYRWQTALRAIFIENYVDIVKTFLEHDADMKLECTLKKTSKTALQLTVKFGNLSIIKALLKRDANAMLDKSKTLHPLILTSKQKNVTMITKLLSAEAPINVHEKKRFYFENINDKNASSIYAVIARLALGLG